MRTIEIGLDVNAALERSRRSFEETPEEILRRLLLGAEGERPPQISAVDLESVEEPGGRITGRWTVELGERRVAASNLKTAYRTVLLLLHERHPEFLQAFSEEQARARRFVARAPGDLYLRSPISRSTTPSR